jgi:hypothetical protein
MLLSCVTTVKGGYETEAGLLHTTLCQSEAKPDVLRRPDASLVACFCIPLFRDFRHSFIIISQDLNSRAPRFAQGSWLVRSIGSIGQWGTLPLRRGYVLCHAACLLPDDPQRGTRGGHVQGCMAAQMGLQSFWRTSYRAHHLQHNSHPPGSTYDINMDILLP